MRRAAVGTADPWPVLPVGSRPYPDGPMHEPRLEINRWFPREVAAGAELTFEARVECPSGCDLQGGEVLVSSSDGSVLASQIVSPVVGASIYETGEVQIQAPAQIGDHAWSVVFRPQADESPKSDSSGHRESVLPVPFRTEAHKTSLAIWDVPSPVVQGEAFMIKVGAKCVEGCNLQGHVVAVDGAEGDRLATGEFGEAPWAASDALYWVDVELVAPTAEGVASWSVGFPAAEEGLPHEGASAKFSFATTRAPDHELTVKVLEQGSTVPVPNAQVSLGVYRASTDESGDAVVALPAGPYELVVWKVGYEAPATSIEVSADLSVRVEAVVLPDNSSWEDD